MDNRRRGGDSYGSQRERTRTSSTTSRDNHRDREPERYIERGGYDDGSRERERALALELERERHLLYLAREGEQMLEAKFSRIPERTVERERAKDDDPINVELRRRLKELTGKDDYEPGAYRGDLLRGGEGMLSNRDLDREIEERRQRLLLDRERDDDMGRGSLPPGDARSRLSSRIQPPHEADGYKERTLRPSRQSSRTVVGLDGKDEDWETFDPATEVDRRVLQLIPTACIEYLERVYSSCAPSDHPYADLFLEAMLSEAITTDTLLTTDWSAMPCPDLTQTKAQCGKRYRRKPKKNPMSAVAAYDMESPTSTPTLMTAEARAMEEAEAERKRKGREEIFEEFMNGKEDDMHVNGQTSRRKTVAQDDTGDIDWDSARIVGTCQNLEKQYLRINEAPDPPTVRPLDVLERALAHVLTKYEANHDYTYACEQLKCIRQDLTIQCIRTEFTVQAYEAHARIALEQDDLSEFNQCQTQLAQLYRDGLPGSLAEFAAYRILYQLYVQNDHAMVATMREMNQDVGKGVWLDPAVQHALAVREAYLLGNYTRFFALLQTVPNMGAAIVRPLAERMRYNTVRVICRAYPYDFPLVDLAPTLGLTSVDECAAYLTQIGAVMNKAGTGLASRDTNAALVRIAADDQNE